MAANKKIFIGPGEGARLPVLDITHKVTAESFGGAFTSCIQGMYQVVTCMILRRDEWNTDLPIIPPTMPKAATTKPKTEK